MKVTVNIQPFFKLALCLNDWTGDIPTALTPTISEYDSKQTWSLLFQGEKKTSRQLEK